MCMDLVEEPPTTITSMEVGGKEGLTNSIVDRTYLNGIVINE